MTQRLSCPQHPDPTDFDPAGFRDAVVHDRCPLSGCELTAWTRTTGSVAVGVAVEETTGRCEPAAGCGAEWALHGDAEVAWFGREVTVDFDWDDEEPADQGEMIE